MSDVDPYEFGFEDNPEPRKKRTRSKRVPQARDVESPVSPEADEDPDPFKFGHYSAAEEDEPGAASRGAAPQQREGTFRPDNAEQRAWYEELADSATSALQGAALNTLDEAMAAGYWATDKLGLTDSHASFEENHDIYKKGLDRVTRDYPIGHGAGQAATGMAIGAAVPGGAVAQGLAQGALSGASEYADSRDLSDTAWATGAGGAMGAGGAVLGNKAAKLFARSPNAALDAELEAIKATSRGRQPAPGPLPAPRPEPPPPAPDWTVEFPNGTPPSGPPTAAAPTPQPDVPYQLGPLDTTPPPAVTGGVPQASERELQRIALQRAQNEMQPSGASRGLRGASTLMALGGHPLPAAGLRAASALVSPGVREGALKSGYLVPNPSAALRTRMGAEAAWEMGAPAALESKVNAQDAEPVAYADGPTFNYAISETLHGGRTGLAPEDEQALTEAVVQGNDDAIRATSFRLRQKNPAYARQVERALRSYNEETR